jgi:hypothetical protein
MTEPVLSAEVRAEGARVLERLVGLFVDELGGPPSFGEFLEILSVSPPTASGLPVPLRLTAKTKGNRRYSDNRKSRVAELNDAVFVEAADLLSLLAEGGSRAGRDTTASDIASALIETLHGSRVSFEDVRAAEIVSLGSVAAKRFKAVVGDVVAVPRSSGDCHLAVVVVARNRIGMALGFLRGTFAVPRVEGAGRPQVHGRPIYTDDRAIASGAWPIVAHREDLLSLFPSEPEIYHSPRPLFPGSDHGEFGSAESPSSGTLRRVTEEEAEEVGLLNNTYRQSYMSTYLQELLDEDEAPF